MKIKYLLQEPDLKTDEGGTQEGKVWEDSQGTGERFTDEVVRSIGTAG